MTFSVSGPSNERPQAGTPETAEAYDALVARLERVVGELESGQLTLERSIEKFAEGVKLAQEATRKLDDAERRIEMLIRNADGTEEAVPFEPEGGKGP
jgi:exodeoxyribonuclease VII small subunit